MSGTKLINNCGFFLLLCLAPAAQGTDLFGVLKALPVKEVLNAMPDLPTQLALPKNPDGLSTSFDNAYSANILLDDFEPSPSEMREAKFGPDGIEITTGFYDLKLQSYCLQAGTYQPKPKGSGYLMAPLEGPRAEIVKRILVNSANAPDIPQPQIQALLWAVLSNAKLDRMPPQYQANARRLLSAQDLYALNGGAVGLIPDRVMRMVLDKANKNVPQAYRDMVRSYASLKSKLESGVSTFEELERIAVFTGDPAGGDTGNVKPGQWMLRPGGYFIRVLPSGYSKTRVQIYRPLAPTLVRNDAGALTEVDFNDGYKVKTEYDPKRVNYRDAETGQTVTYAVIKSITLSGPGGTKQIIPKSPILVPSAESLREPRFTRASPAFSLISMAHAAPAARAEPAAQVAKNLKQAKEVADLLEKYVETQKRAGEPVSQADADRFIEQKLWADGVEAALKLDDTRGKVEWLTDFTGRMTRAGAWLSCVLGGQCVPPDGASGPQDSSAKGSGNARRPGSVQRPGSAQPSLTLPLHEYAAVPADTRRQRLGMSPRIYN
jgi:hypothetical protein